jgi:hypothetical protein
MRRRCGGLALAAALLVPPQLDAQWFDAQFPRRGELQVGLAGQNLTVDHRFTPDGSVQPLTEMFTAVLDSRLVPPLDSLDLALIDLFPTLGLADPEGSTLGPLQYDVLFERTRAPISISFAPTRWLAVFTVVPLVKTVSYSYEQLDTLAVNSGFQATAFNGDPDSFFAGLGAGIATLESMVAADTLPPAAQAEAEALLADARAIRPIRGRTGPRSPGSTRRCEAVSRASSWICRRWRWRGRSTERRRCCSLQGPSSESRFPRTA